MQNLKITLLQCEQFWEDKQANLGHFSNLMNQVGETDLVLIPELFHTSFSMNTQDLAEERDDSLALNWLRDQARSKNSAIYTSFICREAGSVFNRGVFVFPNGDFEFYDKRKLFALAGEDQHYTAGKEACIVLYKDWKINLQICYDLRFPEISRNSLDEHGEPYYDLCLYVANWPQRRSLHWKSLLLARAIENQAFVAGVNRIGLDGKNLQYSGDSMIVTPLGEDVAKTKEGKEDLKTIEISKTTLQEVRSSLNFLKDVRL